MSANIREMMRNTFYDYEQLATFNSECARGIMHTEEWKVRMAKVQEHFDRHHRAMANLYGVKVIE